MDEAHYDTPWEFLHRTISFPPRDRPFSDSSESLLGKPRRDIAAHIRLSKAQENQLSCVSYRQPNNLNPTPNANVRQRITQQTQTPEINARRASSTDFEQARFKFGIGKLRDRGSTDRDARKGRYREDEIIHKGIDRLNAERQLAERDVGSFLIRVRDNGTLALSIRANNGVLHIKLELRNNRWILGEGPSFGSIAAIINFYRCHELPIRGADRMLLNKPVLASSGQQQQQQQQSSFL